MASVNLKLLFVFMGLMLFKLPVVAQENVSGELYDLAKVKSGVRNKRVSSADTTGGNDDKTNSIKPGESRVIADIKGCGVINHIWVTIAPYPNVLSRNDIILRMYWDGNDEPSVESPIGPFFGQGWNEQYNYASFPLAAAPGVGTALSSYFAMPFAQGARIEIENQADINIDHFFYYVDYLEMDKLPKDMGRFHAWYNHESTGVETNDSNNNTTGANNYVFADIKGVSKILCKR